MNKETILGHEKNERILADAIISGNIFPTWVFAGAFGVGKASLAYKFAKCLLSDVQPNDGKLCTDEQTERLVGNRTHPDFAVLEQTDENVSIDDVRHIFDKIHMKPIMSKRRVVILENASNFNKNTSNSLLKILEEPPQDTVIIMICTSIGNLPKTLLSRAAKLHFSPLSIDIVKKYLIEHDIPNAEKLAELSNGSIGAAIKIHENQGIDVYDHLSLGFTNNDVQGALKFIIDNDVDFGIIRMCFLSILHDYANAFADDEANHDADLEKILKIISLINHSDSLMLDKKAVTAAVYEQFFA